MLANLPLDDGLVLYTSFLYYFYIYPLCYGIFIIQWYLPLRSQNSQRGQAPSTLYDLFYKPRPPTSFSTWSWKPLPIRLCLYTIIYNYHLSGGIALLRFGLSSPSSRALSSSRNISSASFSSTFQSAAKHYRRSGRAGKHWSLRSFLALSVFPGKRVCVVFEATSPLNGRHRCPFLSRSYLLSSRADSTKIRTIYISAHIQLPKSHLTTVFVRYSQRHREYSAWRSNKSFCEWSPSTRASERKPKSNVSMVLRLVLCDLLTCEIKACLNILPAFNGNWRIWW